MDEDGGYYAIKGFRYQFDKAIFELLNTTNENEDIFVENIEDISTNSYVIQVKYKEAARFYPSSIKKPVIQLLNLHSSGASSQYVLFAYFGDMNGKENFVDPSGIMSMPNLDQVLGKAHLQFSEEEKTSFLEKFRFKIAPEFQEQFDAVIRILQEQQFAENNDEAIVAYELIANHLQQIVLDHPPENRCLTKAKVKALLSEKIGTIFKSAYRRYMGNQKYFKYIKNQHFTWRNINNHERLFIIDTRLFSENCNPENVLQELIKKFYQITGSLSRRVVKSGAPYIYFHGMEVDYLTQLKGSLSQQGIKLIDGHSFLGADFSIELLCQQTTVHDGIRLKFLSCQNDLSQFLDYKFRNPRKIYNIHGGVNSFNGKEFTHIQLKELNEIMEIL